MKFFIFVLFLLLSGLCVHASDRPWCARDSNHFEPKAPSVVLNLGLPHRAHYCHHHDSRVPSALLDKIPRLCTLRTMMPLPLSVFDKELAEDAAWSRTLASFHEDSTPPANP